MRIRVLIDRYPPILGGAQNNVHELSRRLVAMGHEVTVHTRRVYRHLPPRETIDGVHVRRSGYAPVRVLSKLLCFLSITGALVRARRGHDVVLAVPCVESTDLLPAYVASLFTRVPFVIRSTGFPTFLRPPEGEGALGVAIRNLLIPRPLWDRVLTRSAAYVTQTTVLKEGIARHTTTRCVVIPNGVDRSRFTPASEDEKRDLRERLGLPADRVLLVNTGRYDHEKNQISLLHAIDRLESGLRPGATFTVILGATQRNQATSNEGELKAYVAAKGLEHAVRFVDDSKEVEAYLRAADVFVHPTLDEGMSNALLEAMGAGLPIVCSDIPQETCMFQGRQGHFFPPTDVDTLLEKLLPFVASGERRAEAGAEMDALVREHYENDRLVLEYARLFDEVAPARSGRPTPMATGRAG